MSDFVAILCNSRRLNAALRDLSLEMIEDGLEKLSQIVKERREDEDKKKEAQAERHQKMEQYLQMLRDDNIDPAEVAALASGTSTGEAKTTRAKRPPKYVYKDANGKECTWAGQGRQPVAIREAIANGATIESFLIQK